MSPARQRLLLPAVWPPAGELDGHVTGLPRAERFAQSGAAALVYYRQTMRFAATLCAMAGRETITLAGQESARRGWDALEEASRAEIQGLGSDNGSVAVKCRRGDHSRVPVETTRMPEKENGGRLAGLAQNVP